MSHVFLDPATSKSIIDPNSLVARSTPYGEELCITGGELPDIQPSIKSSTAFSRWQQQKAVNNNHPESPKSYEVISPNHSASKTGDPRKDALMAKIHSRLDGAIENAEKQKEKERIGQGDAIMNLAFAKFQKGFQKEREKTVAEAHRSAAAERQAEAEGWKRTAADEEIHSNIAAELAKFPETYKGREEKARVYETEAENAKARGEYAATIATVMETQVKAHEKAATKIEEKLETAERKEKEAKVAEAHKEQESRATEFRNISTDLSLEARECRNTALRLREAAKDHQKTALKLIKKAEAYEAIAEPAQEQTATQALQAIQEKITQAKAHEEMAIDLAADAKTYEEKAAGETGTNKELTLRMARNAKASAKEHRNIALKMARDAKTETEERENITVEMQIEEGPWKTAARSIRTDAPRYEKYARELEIEAKHYEKKAEHLESQAVDYNEKAMRIATRLSAPASLPPLPTAEWTTQPGPKAQPEGLWNRISNWFASLWFIDFFFRKD
jgi:hypothetical protein